MSIDKTLSALQTFGRETQLHGKSQKVYLKVEYDDAGNPFLKPISKFSLMDNLQWYLIPKQWNPFDLDRVSRVCQKTLTAPDNKSQFSLEHLSGIVELNSKINAHNERMKNVVFSVPHSKIAKVWVPKPLLEGSLDTIHKKHVNEKLPMEVEMLSGIPKGVGIYNVGNTCYQNSLLQLCRFSAVFREQFSHLPLELVFEEIENATSPLDGNAESVKWFRDWVELIGFENATSGTEEDPAELLSYILGSDETPKTFSIIEKKGPPIEQTTLFLEVDAKSTQSTSVQSLIDYNELSLEGDAPKLLPVQIGRYTAEFNEVTTFAWIPPFYQSTKQDFISKKLHTPITPERIIEISNKNTGKKVAYQLVSAVLHKGQSAQTGHYTAVVPTKDDSWIEYDDSFVGPVGDVSKLAKECSLLFYEKIE